MQELNLENLKDVKIRVKNDIVIIYGAGVLGKWALETLGKIEISVNYFADDNKIKQGTEINGILCISYDKLKEISKSGKVSVIVVGSAVKPIIEKLNRLNVNVYSLNSLWQESKGDIVKEFLTMKQSSEEWENKWQIIRNFFTDDNSVVVWKWIRSVAKTKTAWGKNAPKIFSEEENYFVSPIPRLLGENSVLVDCGAFEGDMLWQLERLGISYDKIYLLEANPNVYKRLEKNVKHFPKDKVYAICGAVYDKVGKMYFDASKQNGDELFGRINSEYTNIPAGGGVNVYSLDSLFGDGKIDFLKMDIEGAELPALKGGKNLILKSRPIFAISIYHSLDDVVDIPMYLQKLMKDYTFFLRHHSLLWYETVLYGIPNEL